MRERAVLQRTAPKATSNLQRQPTAQAGGGALQLIAAQLLSRGLTFAGNQILLRYLSPNHLGLSIQLEALSVSILYTARESLRVALQRKPLNDASSETTSARKAELQAAANLAYIAILTGLSLGVFFGTGYLSQASAEVLRSRDFRLAFRCYAIATLLELCSEPAFIVIQQSSLFSTRARVETIAATTRCLSACLTTMLMLKWSQPLSVLPFAVAQLFYAASLLFTYLHAATGVVRANGSSLFPRRLPKPSLRGHQFEREFWLDLFPKTTLGLTIAFYGQSMFKWLLTQGDTLVLSFLADLESQGVFALASNYGGLASRLIFQPVEESSRNVFGKILAEQTPPNGANAARPPNGAERAHEQANESPNVSSSTLPRAKQGALVTSKARATADNSKSSSSEDDCGRDGIHKAVAHLSTIVRAYLILVAIPSITLLPHIFPCLVRLLLGSNSRFSAPSTFHLLSVYSYYIPFLAINGVLDAFVTSVATKAQLGVQSLYMLGITIVYLCFAWIGTRILMMGAVSLVWANLFGMVLRICFSLWFIYGVVSQAEPESKAPQELLRQCIPSGLTLTSTAAVALFLNNMITSASLQQSSTVSKSVIVRLLGLSEIELGFLMAGAVILASSM